MERHQDQVVNGTLRTLEVLRGSEGSSVPALAFCAVLVVVMLVVFEWVPRANTARRRAEANELKRANLRPKFVRDTPRLTTRQEGPMDRILSDMDADRLGAARIRSVLWSAGFAGWVDATARAVRHDPDLRERVSEFLDSEAWADFRSLCANVSAQAQEHEADTVLLAGQHERRAEEWEEQLRRAIDEGRRRSADAW